MADETGHRGCDVRGCDGEARAMIEPGVYLCPDHDRARQVVCRFCAVPLVSAKDTRALVDPHRGGCPRRSLPPE